MAATESSSALVATAPKDAEYGEQFFYVVPHQRGRNKGQNSKQNNDGRKNHHGGGRGGGKAVPVAGIILVAQSSHSKPSLASTHTLASLAAHRCMCMASPMRLTSTPLSLATVGSLRKPNVWTPATS